MLQNMKDMVVQQEAQFDSSNDYGRGVELALGDQPGNVHTRHVNLCWFYIYFPHDNEDEIEVS